MDLTLHIDTSSFPKTQKVKKSMSEEEQTKVKEQNELVKKQKEKMADDISLKFSQFKRDFMSAPIRRAIKGLASGDPSLNHTCQINYRPDEKFWVIANKGDVSVSFGMQFDNATDKALARIFLLEFSGDIKRYCKNPCSVVYYDQKFPESVLEKFPACKDLKYSNGVISFSLQPSHLQPNYE